jgi:hypothetical protein
LHYYRAYHVYARSGLRGYRNFTTHAQAHHFARLVRHMHISARVVHLGPIWQVRLGRVSHWHQVRWTTNGAAAAATAASLQSYGFQTRVVYRHVP